MDPHAAKQQRKTACGSRLIVNCDAKYPQTLFYFVGSQADDSDVATQQGRRKVSSEMERVLQRTDERNQLTLFIDWLIDAFERASVRDHDRYLAGATNTREASRRLHEIEQGVASFHA
jgi:hypothetical protein